MRTALPFPDAALLVAAPEAVAACSEDTVEVQSAVEAALESMRRAESEGGDQR